MVIQLYGYMFVGYRFKSEIAHPQSEIPINPKSEIKRIPVPNRDSFSVYACRFFAPPNDSREQRGSRYGSAQNDKGLYFKGKQGRAVYRFVVLARYYTARPCFQSSSKTCHSERSEESDNIFYQQFIFRRAETGDKKCPERFRSFCASFMVIDCH
jgi:hypothetical protein